MDNNQRVFKMPFATIYPVYVKKLERKSVEKPQDKLDACIFWLTGYDKKKLQHVLDTKADFESFFKKAPRFNAKAKNIKGVICGYRIEEIKDPLMRKIRYLDKLVDDLARGRDLERVLDR